mgnify:FL=1
MNVTTNKIDSENATVSASGDYDILVTGSNGCSNTSSIAVTMDTVTPTVIIDPADTLNCNINSIVIDAGNTTGTNETYTWTTNTGTIVSGANQSDVTVSSGGYYYLLVTNDNGCSSFDSVNIETAPSPIADFTTSLTSGAVPLVVDFTNNSIGNIVADAWTFGDGNTSVLSDPNNTYTEIGVYTVELVVTDQFGCTDTATVIIDASGDYTISIPNIFTPNIDGNNDVFHVDIEHASDFQATIFNRWGQLVYEWDGVDGGWDGYTYSGVLASEGTYYYLFVVTDLKGEIHEYQGHFRLAR